MQNSPSSPHRPSTSEQLRSIGFTIALISLPIIAGTCGRVFDVLNMPVAKATKPTTDPPKSTKSSESKEKEETVLTQEAVRKILEELGYDVDAAFTTLGKRPEQDWYSIVGSDDEKVIAPLRGIMAPKKPNPEWSVSVTVQVQCGSDGHPRIVVRLEESRLIKFGKFRAPTSHELAVITPGPFPLREVQMADGMWLEPRLGRSGMDTKEQKTLLEALKKLPPKAQPGAREKQRRSDVNNFFGPNGEILSGEIAPKPQQKLTDQADVKSFAPEPRKP